MTGFSANGTIATAWQSRGSSNPLHMPFAYTSGTCVGDGIASETSSDDNERVHMQAHVKLT